MSLIRTLLIRVSGPDQLGVSAELFEVLSAIGAVVKDIEQIVVRRRLTLDVLIEVDTVSYTHLTLPPTPYV